MSSYLAKRPVVLAHVVAAVVMLAIAFAVGSSIVVVPLVVIVLAIHLAAASALPGRFAIVAAIVALLFAAAVPLWSGSDAVDCDPSCSTYQNTIAAIFVIAVVAFAADILAAVGLTAWTAVRGSRAQRDR